MGSFFCHDELYVYTMKRSGKLRSCMVALKGGWLYYRLYAAHVRPTCLPWALGSFSRSSRGGEMHVLYTCNVTRWANQGGHAPV